MLINNLPLREGLKEEILHQGVGEHSAFSLTFQNNDSAQREGDAFAHKITLIGRFQDRFLIVFL